MGDVRVGHAQVAAADTGNAASAFRAPVERGEFTDTVIVAELQPRHFALELEILRVRRRPARGNGYGLPTPILV